MALYNYLPTRVPDGSGAGVMAFVPMYALPLFTLPGFGTPYTFKWKATQPEQLYYNQAQYMQGKIGITAGQMALQPLLDNQNPGVNG